MGDEATQALELLDKVFKIKEQGLKGEQITRHFIKCQLAPIKERSRTAFEYDGKNDPNREDPDSLDFKIMKDWMYKIFSSGIVVDYFHILLVVPYNAFNPPLAVSLKLAQSFHFCCWFYSWKFIILVCRKMLLSSPILRLPSADLHATRLINRLVVQK